MQSSNNISSSKRKCPSVDVGVDEGASPLKQARMTPGYNPSVRTVIPNDVVRGHPAALSAFLEENRRLFHVSARAAQQSKESIVTLDIHEDADVVAFSCEPQVSDAFPGGDRRYSLIRIPQNDRPWVGEFVHTSLSTPGFVRVSGVATYKNRDYMLVPYQLFQFYSECELPLPAPVLEQLKVAAYMLLSLSHMMFVNGQRPAISAKHGFMFRRLQQSEEFDFSQVGLLLGFDSLVIRFAEGAVIPVFIAHQESCDRKEPPIVVQATPDFSHANNDDKPSNRVVHQVSFLDQVPNLFINDYRHPIEVVKAMFTASPKPAADRRFTYDLVRAFVRDLFTDEDNNDEDRPVDEQSALHSSPLGDVHRFINMMARYDVQIFHYKSEPFPFAGDSDDRQDWDKWLTKWKVGTQDAQRRIDAASDKLFF